MLSTIGLASVGFLSHDDSAVVPCSQVQNVGGDGCERALTSCSISYGLDELMVNIVRVRQGKV